MVYKSRTEHILMIILQCFNFFSAFVSGLFLLFAAYLFFMQSFLAIHPTLVVHSIFWLPVSINLLRRRRWAWVLALVGVTSILFGNILFMIYSFRTVYWFPISFNLIYLFLLLINRKFYK